MAFGFATNLTDANVVRRLRLGIASLACALVMAVLLKATETESNLWPALFVPLFVAANFFFQAMYMTCGYSAYSGVRHTSSGTERILDPGQLRSLRLRGTKQIALALATAALLTWMFLRA